MTSKSIRAFVEAEKKIAARKGRFALFALMLRSDVMGVASTTDIPLTDRWDLVVSAPWLAADDKKSLDEMVQALTAQLKVDDLRGLSRIALLEPSNAFVRALNQAFSVEHGTVEVRHSNVFGNEIDHAYVITSRRLTN